MIVLASRNAHKIDELRRMAPEVGWVPLPEGLGDPPESGDTFLANALEKARFGFARTGRACLADDSGLEVDALGGRPGVWSKRYSPEGTDAANNRLLLATLGHRSDRRARYRCVLALVGGFGERVMEGTCEGAIAFEPRGAGGFGYDPLFLPDAAPGRTMAELDAAGKDVLSHRGAAMRALRALLGREPELLR